MVLNEDERRLLPFLRMWCCAEIDAGRTRNRPIVLMCGKFEASKFVRQEPGSLLRLAHLVNVEHAEAKLETDRQRLLAEFQASSGGLGALNALVKRAFVGAALAAECLEVQAAVCQQHLGPLQSVLVDAHEHGPVSSAAVRAAAAGGFTKELQRLLAEGASCTAATASADGGSNVTALMSAARGGSLEAMRLLIEYKASVNS